MTELFVVAGGFGVLAGKLHHYDNQAHHQDRGAQAAEDEDLHRWLLRLLAGRREARRAGGGPLPPADHDGPVLRGLVSRKSPRKSMLPAPALAVSEGGPAAAGSAAAAPGADKRGLAMGTHHALARQFRAQGHLAITVGARNSFSHDKIQRLGGRLFRKTRGYNRLSINHAAALEKPRAQGHPHGGDCPEFRLPNSEFLTTATAHRLAPKRCNCYLRNFPCSRSARLRLPDSSPQALPSSRPAISRQSTRKCRNAGCWLVESTHGCPSRHTPAKTTTAAADHPRAPGRPILPLASAACAGQEAEVRS